MLKVDQDEMARILDNVVVVKVVQKLVLGNGIPFCYALTLLLVGLDLNFGKKSLRLELALVSFVYVLVVETLPEQLVCLVSPDLFPLSLRMVS